MKDFSLDQVLSDTNLYGAWLKVKDNHGCAGIDGESILDFENNLTLNLDTLCNEVRYETYRPAPLLRIEVPKKSGGMRPLSIPSVRDRILQTAVTRILIPLFEAEFEACSFAYRAGRSVAQAVSRVNHLREQGYLWVVDADITRFFDEIDHNLLMAEVKKLVSDEAILKLIHLWLKADIIDGKQRFTLHKGVPQGSPISPLLANLYLDHLDEVLLKNNQRLVRFADDFLVLCKDQSQAEKALELTEKVLKSLRLNINKEKTRVVDFNHGFRFLGVQFVRSLAIQAKYPEELPLNIHNSALCDGVAERDAEGGEPSRQTAPSSIMQAAFDVAGIEVDDLPSEEGMEDQTEFLTETPEESDLSADHDPRLRTLYLMEHGNVLGKESERLVVRRNGNVISEIPAIKVDQVMVFGNSQITTQAMQFCLQEKIPIFLLSGRGRFYGVVDTFDTDPVLLHRDQFTRSNDEAFSLTLARSFVAGKIANCRVIFSRLSRKREAPALRQATTEMKSVLERLERAETLNQLRGFEGNAARIYFGALAKTVDSKWGFNKRVRQPPTDPVNSLLSYGYTILFYNIYSLLRARGLNPHVGHLHPLRSGHPALVSDLMEEFRAIVVDAVVFNLIFNEKLSPSDFTLSKHPGEPCLINANARKKYVQALEEKFNAPLRHPVSGLQLDYRRCMEHQARHLAAVIRGKDEHYIPMVLR